MNGRSSMSQGSSSLRS